MNNPSKPTVVIAGAAGFVGHALIRALAGPYHVIALSRSERTSLPDVEWRACDLFSLLQIESAVKDADYAIYLVHSMLPARLTQANFEDMDLILADNFARAAAQQGIKQIIYLGGLIPDSKTLSPHLASRLEVEHILAARGVPITSLRAGLIVGVSGSSFRMMLRLVERLPILLCPKWTRSRTHPIALEDVVNCIHFALCNPDCMGKTLDIGGPEQMTYIAMMQATAQALRGHHKIICTVPFFSPSLSVELIHQVTGAHRELVRPLVQSLKYEMLAKPNSEMTPVLSKARPFQEVLQQAVQGEQALTKSQIDNSSPLSRADSWSKVRGYVVSIQRLPLPSGKDGRWVAREYARWLPTLFRYLVTVDSDKHLNLKFRLFLLRQPLLELSYSEDRSSPDRPLYYITGGLLLAPPHPDDHRSPARLEFRETPDHRHVMASIFNYRPSLPWKLYRFTQAPIHLAVMFLFRSHLKKLSQQS